MKIIINVCYGGFNLSNKAYERLIELGIPLVDQKEMKPDVEAISKFEGSCLGSEYFDNFSREGRTHPLVIQVIEELGKDANGPCSELKVIEIPDGISYEIDEYDGIEHVAESHRTWS